MEGGWHCPSALCLIVIVMCLWLTGAQSSTFAPPPPLFSPSVLSCHCYCLCLCISLCICHCLSHVSLSHRCTILHLRSSSPPLLPICALLSLLLSLSLCICHCLSYQCLCLTGAQSSTSPPPPLFPPHLCSLGLGLCPRRAAPVVERGEGSKAPAASNSLPSR